MKRPAVAHALSKPSVHLEGEGMGRLDQFWEGRGLTTLGSRGGGGRRGVPAVQSRPGGGSGDAQCLTEEGESKKGSRLGWAECHWAKLGHKAKMADGNWLAAWRKK
jgi:hypothetical protein